ncbi:MAG: hypothetical protein GY842_06485, partial [bacterium]|nr:hypothetical protein [bacterium]
ESSMGAAQCALAPPGRDPAQVQTWTFTYEDRFDQVKTETDPLGRTTTYVYDYEEGVGETGNLVRTIFPPVADEYGTVLTPTTTMAYNEWGQVVAETDVLGVITVYSYTQGTPDEVYGQPEALFADGVTPVPGLLTRIVRDYGGLNETSVYRDFDGAGNPQMVLGPGATGGGTAASSCATCSGSYPHIEEA